MDLYKIKEVREVKRAAGKVMYLLSFVVAAIIACIVFNSLVYDTGKAGVRRGRTSVILGSEDKKEEVESLNNIELLGILHMDRGYETVTNVIFSNGCVYLNKDGEVIESFKYDYVFSLRHLQEAVKYDFANRYKSGKMNREQLTNFIDRRFYMIDKEERSKVLNSVFVNKEVEVYDIEVKSLSDRELQKMMRLIDEKGGVKAVVEGRNFFMYWE